MSRFAALAMSCASVAGCDVVFSREPPTQAPDDAPADVGIDAPFIEHDGRWVRRAVFEGAAVTTEDQPYTAIEMMPRLAIDDGPDGTLEWNFDTGTFSYASPSGAWTRVILEFPELATEVQTRATSPSFTDLAFDRISAPASQGTTTISGTINNHVPGNLYHFVTTGVWADLAFSGVPVDATRSSYSITWPTSKRLVDALAGDRVFLLGLEDRTSYYAIARYDVNTTFRMRNGANAASGTLVTPTTTARCTRIDNLQLDTLEQRLATAYPEYDALVKHWGVYAEPEASLGPHVLSYLATTSEAGKSLASVDLDYHDPYGNFDHVALSTAVRDRTIVTGPSTGIVVHVSISEYALVDHAACPSRGVTTLPASVLQIPRQFRLAGQLVTDDNVGAIAIGDARTLELTWESSNGELFFVALYEIDSGATSLTKLARYFRTTEPHATIDATTLADGKRYVLVVRAARGYLDAASGNFTVVTYPHSTAVGVSGAFSVAR